MIAGTELMTRCHDLLGQVVLVIAHNAAFDRPLPEKRLPDSPANIGSCRIDIDWKGEGIRSSALEFVAYVLRYFHDGHRAERLSRHPPCAGATAPWYRTAGIAGSLGTGEIADMAVMGERCGD
jgi:hypothetical protein